MNDLFVIFVLGFTPNPLSLYRTARYVVARIEVTDDIPNPNRIRPLTKITLSGLRPLSPFSATPLALPHLT